MFAYCYRKYADSKRTEQRRINDEVLARLEKDTVSHFPDLGKLSPDSISFQQYQTLFHMKWTPMLLSCYAAAGPLLMVRGARVVMRRFSWPKDIAKGTIFHSRKFWWGMDLLAANEIRAFAYDSIEGVRMWRNFLGFMPSSGREIPGCDACVICDCAAPNNCGFFKSYSSGKKWASCSNCEPVLESHDPLPHALFNASLAALSKLRVEEPSFEVLDPNIFFSDHPNLHQHQRNLLFGAFLLYGCKGSGLATHEFELDKEEELPPSRDKTLSDWIWHWPSLKHTWHFRHEIRQLGFMKFRGLFRNGK